MQLQNFAPEARRDKTLEKIESRKLSPEATANEMLRQGDREVTDAKSGLEDLRREFKGAEDASLAEQLKSMEADLDAAWEELSAETKAATTPETPTEEELAREIPEEPAEKKIEAKSAMPTAEETEWEIPEEAPISAVRPKQEEPALSPEQLASPGDAMREILRDSERPFNFKGAQELIKTPEGREQALSFLDEQLDRAMQSDIPFDAFERAMAMANQDKELLSMASERFQGLIGKKYAEKMFSPEFRSSLRTLNTSLEGRLGEEGPEICADRNLSQLIAINETMGQAARDMVAVANLHSQAPELAYAMSGAALQVTEMNFDEESGELTSKIILALDYKDPRTQREIMNEKTGKKEIQSDKATIERHFFHKPIKGQDGKIKRDTNGDTQVYKSVHHELLAIPKSFQSGGIAKKVTEQSLRQYDRMSLDAITLHAAKEVGGYAWATYGYGWNQEEMISRKLGGKEYDEVSDENKAELLIEAVKEQTNDAKQRFFKEVGAGLTDEEKAAFEAAYSDLEKNILTTPQHLMRIGLRTLEDGSEVPDPPFFRGASGNYYRGEDFQKAIESGEEQHSPEDQARIKKGKQPIAFHAGKVGMIGKKIGSKVVDGLDWYGKVELKATGPQGGKNREILEKKLRET